MADEKVRLALRVHDEVNPMTILSVPEIMKSSSSNPENSVMGVTYLVPTSAHAARISFTG